MGIHIHQIKGVNNLTQAFNIEIYTQILVGLEQVKRQ